MKTKKHYQHNPIPSKSLSILPLHTLDRNKYDDLIELSTNSTFQQIFELSNSFSVNFINKLIHTKLRESRHHDQHHQQQQQLSFIILKHKSIIGYCDIISSKLTNIPRTHKTFHKCIRFYIIESRKIDEFSNFIVELHNILKRLKLSIFDIWTFIPDTEIDLVPILLNCKFLHAIKRNNRNAYIYDFRLSHIPPHQQHQHQHEIATKSLTEIPHFTTGIARGYEKSFILSIKQRDIYVNMSYLRNHLLNAGLVEVKSPQQRPAFMFLEVLETMRPDARYYDTECAIMNILSKSKHVITNKYWLYLNFHKLFPRQCAKYLAATVELSEFDKSQLTDPANVFIAKPVGLGAWSGRDIIVMHHSDPAAIDAVYKLAAKYENVIVSEYISRAMLWNGKKMHLRAFLMACVMDGVYSTYFMDFYRIYHAKLDYVQRDWNNHDIHDTHLKSTSRNIFGPDDIEDKHIRAIFTDIINPKIHDCMYYISKILEKACVPYANSKYGFEIFGCDIMIRDNYDIVLMEINEHTGLELKPEPVKIDEFSRRYFDYINEIVILPLVQNIHTTKYKPIYKNKIDG